MRNRIDFAGLNPTAFLSVVLIAAFGAGCKLYHADLLDESVDGQSAAGATSAGDGSAGTGGAGAMPFDPDTCKSGDCWWSTDSPDGCRSTGVPPLPETPAGPDDGVQISEIYLGFTEVRIGANGPDGQPSDTAWETIGFDLDKHCVNSATCGGVNNPSCEKSPGPAIPYDGERCRDNSWGRLQPSIAIMPELDAFGISETAINCELWRGGYNMIVRLTGYNGKQDDPQVRVDYYLSTGLEEDMPWACPNDDFKRYPRWRSARTWAVDDSTLSGPIAAPGTLPDSMFSDAEAYVKYGYLVARVPDDTPQGFVGTGDPYRGFVFKSQRGLFVGRLHKNQDDTWEMTDGLLGGRIRREDLIQAYRESGFCGTGDVVTFYQVMLDYVNETVDLLASGADDPSAPCDAMSFALGFEASQLLPGQAVKHTERVECCAPGRSQADCAQSCGDGTLDEGETCDTAIAAGSPGACPTACPKTESCVPQQLTGSACAVTCMPVPITMVGAKDDCCPPGANVTTDADCKAICGNGVVERGETCDPPGSCKPCDSSNRCVPVSFTGSAETCNLRCDMKPITSCIADDGCCPAECGRAAGATQDIDCSATCRNKMVEGNETCDDTSSRPCGTDCDDKDGCTTDIQTGSAENCSFQCSHAPITELIDNDGCCPAGASANADIDCRPSCGNGVLESGEECDDGNDKTGDGCEACKTVSPQDTCLKQIGDDACGRCTCSRCTSQVLGCYTADARIAQPCSALVNCSRIWNCGTPDCYCGAETSLFTCLAGGANGKCMKETTDAAGTTVLVDISQRATDPNNPLGRANALFTCMEMSCSQDCKAKAPMAQAQ